MKRIITALLLAALLLGLCACGRGQTRTASDQSAFTWQIQLLGYEVKTALHTDAGVPQYDGAVLDVAYDNAPSEGCTFLILTLDIQKSRAGGGGFDWQKLTVRDENGNVTQWGVQISTNDPFMFSPFALQNSENGENLMTSDGKTALFNTEGNAEALQFLVDLSQKYQAMPEGVIVWADSTSNFMAGTAAMLYMSSGSLTNVLKNTDFEVGTCFLPAGKRYGSATGGANFYIFDGISDEKLAATWKFIRWITEPERAAQWSIDTGYVATRKSCFELDVLKDYFAAVPQAATAGDQLQYAGSELMLYDNTRCWDILKNAIDAAMTLTMTPEEALAQAQAEVDQVLADYQ